METEVIQKAEPAKSRPQRRARRRGQGGSIFRRGLNWTVVYRTPAGKQKWEGGFRTKEEAQNKLGTVLGTIRDNRYVEPKDILFKAFCEDWMIKSKAILKPKTWASYQSALKVWITPAFGEWPICDINRSSVKDFVGKLLAKQELSRKFVKNVLILLHRLFEEAIDREYVAANPARKLRLPTSESAGLSESQGVIVPTPEEVVKTFAELPPTYQVLLATSAITGARRAELLGLKWEDIDWLGSMIQIRQTLQRLTKSLLDAGSFRGVDRLGD